MASRERDARFFLLLLAGTAGLVLVAYRDALRAWFAADDFLWLDRSNAADVLASFTGPWGHGLAYRPLARVSFWIDSLLFGRDACFWHLHSLLLHALGATLLGFLLYRLSGRRVLGVLAAAIFALLPLAYEATIWVSGRLYVLCLPLALSAALLFDRFLAAPRAGRLAACLAVLAATFLTYEGSVYAVPLLALVALVRRGQGAPLRPLATGLAAAVALALVYLVVRRALLGPGDFMPTRTVLSWPFLASLRAVAGVFLSQVEPALWPYVCVVPLVAWWAPRMLLVAVLGALAALAGYAPFSFVDGFGMRYLYAAGAGLAVALAALLVGLARVPWLGKPAAAVLLVLLLRGEWQGVRGAARDWADAATVARTTLANVARAAPRTPGPGVVLVFDVPLSVGRAMTFYTYFDVAMRLFHPEVPRLALSTHYFSLLDERPGYLSVLGIWEREAARRAVGGLPPLGCPAALFARSVNRAELARALLSCKATSFVALDRPNMQPRRLSREDAAERLRTWLGPDALEPPSATALKPRGTRARGARTPRAGRGAPSAPRPPR